MKTVSMVSDEMPIELISGNLTDKETMPWGRQDNVGPLLYLL